MSFCAAKIVSAKPAAILPSRPVFMPLPPFAPRYSAAAVKKKVKSDALTTTTGDAMAPKPAANPSIESAAPSTTASPADNFLSAFLSWARESSSFPANLHRPNTDSTAKDMYFFTAAGIYGAVRLPAANPNAKNAAETTAAETALARGTFMREAPAPKPHANASALTLKDKIKDIISTFITTSVCARPRGGIEKDERIDCNGNKKGRETNSSPDLIMSVWIDLRIVPFVNYLG